MLGQGGRGGGDPAGHAAEDNAGPAPFLPYLQSTSDGLNSFLGTPWAL